MNRAMLWPNIFSHHSGFINKHMEIQGTHNVIPVIHLDCWYPAGCVHLAGVPQGLAFIYSPCGEPTL